jgi:uncharacterized integral membrane protein
MSGFFTPLILIVLGAAGAFIGVVVGILAGNARIHSRNRDNSGQSKRRRGRQIAELIRSHGKCREN